MVDMEHDTHSSASGDEATVAATNYSGSRRKGTPWTMEEHFAFLRGLERLGNWRSISKYFVPTRTPTQVASHAQKHFLRVGGATKRRSRFTAIEEEVYGTAVARANAAQQQQGASGRLGAANHEPAHTMQRAASGKSSSGAPARLPSSAGTYQSIHHVPLPAQGIHHYTSPTRPPAEGIATGLPTQMLIPAWPENTCFSAVPTSAWMVQPHYTPHVMPHHHHHHHFHQEVLAAPVVELPVSADASPRASTGGGEVEAAAAAAAPGSSSSSSRHVVVVCKPQAQLASHVGVASIISGLPAPSTGLLGGVGTDLHTTSTCFTASRLVHIKQSCAPLQSSCSAFRVLQHAA